MLRVLTRGSAFFSFPILKQGLFVTPQVSARFLSIFKNMESRDAFTSQYTGSKFGLDYKVYFGQGGRVVSPFHDIPLYANKDQKIFNMVVEVSRWSNAKFEVNKTENYNPIKQDIKKGKPRFVPNVFPYNGYIWNYGAFPQTWEDPSYVDEHTNAKGDNDPLDVCEIGSMVHKCGSVVQVKVLGTFALIDEGETDWKIIALDVTDPMADKCNDLEDVETHFPGLLKATYDWFRLYKIPDGKPENHFAFEGKPKPKDFALKVIDLANECWAKLMDGTTQCDGVNTTNSTLDNTKKRVSTEEANSFLSKVPPASEEQPVPREVSKWHYVNA